MMIAVDTNVLIRLITNDDVEQAERAQSLIVSNQVVVSLTVILEAEWVLRSRLGFASGRVIDALQAFADIPTVKLEQSGRVLRALGWASRGMEFADALHLASADECESFASFDRKFRKRAVRLNAAPPVVEP